MEESPSKEETHVKETIEIPEKAEKTPTKDVQGDALAAMLKKLERGLEDVERMKIEFTAMREDFLQEKEKWERDRLRILLQHRDLVQKELDKTSSEVNPSNDDSTRRRQQVPSDVPLRYILRLAVESHSLEEK